MIDVAGPFSRSAAAYGSSSSTGSLRRRREKRWVKAAFGQYVSPKVLDILMEDPAN